MGAKKSSKAKSSKKSSGLLSKGKSALSGLLGKKGKGTGRRSRKKSALWYAKEIQRIKLKRRYMKLRLGGL